MNLFYDYTFRTNDAEEEKNIAIDYFKYYVTKHGGELSERFDNNITVKIVPDNSMCALASTSLENNRIRIKKSGLSIITMFHELRHMSDQWVDPSTGNIYGCWEYEKNYGAQKGFNPDNTIYIKRGIHGKFMGEAVAELYATKMFWELCNNCEEAIDMTRTRNYYDEEVTILIIICIALGLDEDFVLNLPSRNDIGRNYLRQRCEEITKHKEFWDVLEFNLDYIAIKKHFDLTDINHTLSYAALHDINVKRECVKTTLTALLQASLHNRIISYNDFQYALSLFDTLPEYRNNYGYAM